MAIVTSLHEALRTEVVDRHGVSGLNLVVVRLQKSKTDVTFSLHGEPTMLNFSGNVTPAHVLERLGFAAGSCTFVDRKVCLARAVPEGFDIRTFANAVTAATESLRLGCNALLDCGFYLETQLFGTGGIGPLPEQMLSPPRGDGHNAATTKRMKEAEDDSFKFVLTWIDSGEHRKGWTIHYIPKHPPLSAEVTSMMDFLGLRGFSDCPEADFDPCRWRFLHFIPGHDFGFNGPAEIAHKWFEAHAIRFSKGIADLLHAEAVVNSFGFNVLPSVRTNVPAEVVQPPRAVRRSGVRKSATAGGRAFAGGGAPAASSASPAPEAFEEPARR